jgi:transposase
LNFFKYPCFVHARVPRVRDAEGNVRLVQVPWARAGSGFTMDFERHALSLMREMPVLSVSRELGVRDTRLWRLLHFHVERAFEAQDIGHPKRIGVDETASRRGHEYITVFVGLDTRRVLFVTPGRTGVALAQFRFFLESKGASTSGLMFASDLSPAYRSGIREAFPDASITLDKFHLVAMLSKAVDETRRSESRHYSTLYGSRWMWLKNPESLNTKQQHQLRSFLTNYAFSDTAKAYHLKLQFQALFFQQKTIATKLFDAWLDLALESGLKFVEHVATTFFRQRESILNWFETRISNGVLEGLHSVLQTTKNKARGYKNTKNLIAMSYLLHGKLDAITHTI